MHWIQATKSLAKAIAVVAAGPPTVEGDSVKARKERANVLGKEATGCIAAANNDVGSKKDNRSNCQHCGNPTSPNAPRTTWYH